MIFDCDTNGVARKLRGHLRQIQSLSWSANDRYLLSASQDWKAILWDLQTGQRLRTVRFEAPLFIAELHPTNHLLLVVALFDDQPVLVDLTNEEPIKHTLPSAPKRTEEELAKATEKQAAQDAKQTTTVASFSSTGSHIICGTNKGWLNIISTSTCQTLASTRIASSIVILIKLTTAGQTMVINCSDRTIRTFHIPDFNAPDGYNWDTFHLEPKRKYQDVINRLSWNHVGWSPSGEYVIASTLMNHSIYIWEEVEGSLVKILEAPDEISVLDFHPFKPWLAAVGVDEGRVYIWSVPTPQSWAALAPDFVEVEENVEYQEADDEFDIQPAEELTKRRLDLEDEEIDVVTKDEPLQPEPSFVMPVLMDIEASDEEDEVVAIGTGQYRRKSPAKEWRAGEMEVTPSGDEGRTASSRGNGTGGGRAGAGSKRKQRD